MRKTFTRLHRWLALPFGLFISIMCFTGALLVWRSEIASLCGASDGDLPFFRAVMQLHRWLFIVPDNPHGGMSVGRFLMGVSAIACTLIVVSGFVLWWPRTRTQLHHRLRVNFTKGWRRFVYDSHVSLGIYSAIFLLLMSLTGPVWSFGWYRKAAVAAIGGKEMPRKPGQGGSGEQAPQGKGLSEGDRRADFPSSRDGHNGRPARSKTAPFQHERTPQGRHDAGDKRSDLPASSHNEATRGNREGRENNRSQRGHEGQGADKGKSSPQRIFISLHMGKWGGLATRIIYTLAALIGGFLPISGYYLWWKRRHHA